MIRRILLAVVLSVTASFGAQGSGIFFEGHVSRGVMTGDTLYAGLSEIYGIPIEYQYCVRYAFSAGYEQSFSKLISIRAGVGYQNALMNAYSATIQNSSDNNGDYREVASIDSDIVRHWLTIPIDFKVTLPFRRSGFYIAAGPKASILLSSKGTDNITIEEYTITNDTPRFNLALGGDIGLEFAIGNLGHLFVESGYHQGILNTSPSESGTTQESEINFLKLGFRINLSHPEK